MSIYFATRPIFAWVISLVLMGCGIAATIFLPIQQYPNVAPPTIAINAFYPGASADAIQRSVTSVIERQVSSVPGLTYTKGSSSSSGIAQVSAVFESGTDPDDVQVQIQNKISQILPILPTDVQRLGVSVDKASSSFVLAIGLYTDDGSLSQTDLSDIIDSQLKNKIQAIEGVGSIQVFGNPRAMRVWLDPDKMLKYGVVAADVVGALRANNIQVPAGQIGGAPTLDNQQFVAPVTSSTLLKTAEEFRDILIYSTPQGASIRVGDVARVELGSSSYNIAVHYNSYPAAGMGISLAPGANSLEVSNNVKTLISDLSVNFPESLQVAYAIDTSPYVLSSIKSVIETLLVAIVLVVAVIFLFLQNARNTFIPSITIPIVLMGTMASLYFFGFSINILTLFALVLAIGMLVDDAIVVVENVQRVRTEDPELTPLQATIISMKELQGALVGTTLVLIAVFFPLIFFGGSTGIIYRQFAVTIMSAMSISLLVTLMLTPALCATMLPEKYITKDPYQGLFKYFNIGFDYFKIGYLAILKQIIRFRFTSFVAFIGITYLTIVLFSAIPASFLPEEDQGVLFTQIETAPNSTISTTMESMEQMEDFYLKQNSDKVEGMFSVAGFGFNGIAENTGLAFIKLKPFEERQTPDGSVNALSGAANAAYYGLKNAQAFAFAPPPILELGNATGFTMELQATEGTSYQELEGAMYQLLGKAAKDQRLLAVRPSIQAGSGQLEVHFDKKRAQIAGVNPSDLDNTLAIAWGGTYVNDFNFKGNLRRVYVQGEPDSRANPGDLAKWHVRNNKDNSMVNVANFSNTKWSHIQPTLTTFNTNPSILIQGQGTPGVSSSQAMDAIAEIAETLPSKFSYSWTGLSLDEANSRNAFAPLFLIAALLVFLFLAAVYESWTIPISIMFMVPLGVFGAVVSTWFLGYQNGIYFKIGMLITMGLATKNAILLIEFAKLLHEEKGMSVVESAMEAAKMRLRPILMTSLTFVLGVLPLATAIGQGSGSSNAVGVVVIGGITSATLLVVFFAPLFFVYVFYALKRKDVHAVPNQQVQ